ncbi:MAG: GIY-YIG nuclease family protein [Bacteroidota bacterium]
MYFVYIIKSLSQNLHYIGHTADLTDRLKRHNENRSSFTKGKGPWQLIISFPCTTKSEAYRLKLKLKSFKNSEKAIDYIH